MSQPGHPSASRVFEILVRENADMLTAFLRSLLVRPDSVDDLFQETMLVAWRRLDDYDHSRPLGPWLRGIAANLVLEHRRKSAQRAKTFMSCEPEVLEGIERRFEALARTPGDTFRDRAARLRLCVERLPERLREIVELVYARGMLLREAAASVGAEEEAVKKRIQRARLSLEECLRTSGAGA